MTYKVFKITEESLKELFDKAECCRGKIERVKDPSLLEEMIHNAGYAFDDPDWGNELFKQWSQEIDEDFLNEIKEYASRAVVGFGKQGVELKYEEVIQP